VLTFSAKEGAVLGTKQKDIRIWSMLQLCLVKY